MCKELNDEQQMGMRSARDLAEHLRNMGAARALLPVAIDGDRYCVVVRRMATDIVGDDPVYHEASADGTKTCDNGGFVRQWAHRHDPVSEPLPELGKAVLLRIPRLRDVGYVVGVRHASTGKWVSCETNMEFLDGCVTGWLPLPPVTE